MAAFIKIHIEIDKLTGCHNKYIEEKIKLIKNQFWVDTLQAFINIVENIQVTKDVLLKSPIFYNHNVTVGGACFFYKGWF